VWTFLHIHSGWLLSRVSVNPETVPHNPTDAVFKEYHGGCIVGPLDVGVKLHCCSDGMFVYFDPSEDTKEYRLGDSVARRNSAQIANWPACEERTRMENYAIACIYFAALTKDPNVVQLGMTRLQDRFCFVQFALPNRLPGYNTNLGYAVRTSPPARFRYYMELPVGDKCQLVGQSILQFGLGSNRQFRANGGGLVKGPTFRIGLKLHVCHIPLSKISG